MLLSSPVLYFCFLYIHVNCYSLMELWSYQGPCYTVFYSPLFRATSVHLSAFSFPKCDMTCVSSPSSTYRMPNVGQKKKRQNKKPKGKKLTCGCISAQVFICFLFQLIGLLACDTCRIKVSGSRGKCQTRNQQILSVFLFIYNRLSYLKIRRMVSSFFTMVGRYAIFQLPISLQFRLQ